MSKAAAIVSTLLESDEIDPKAFVQRKTKRRFYSIVFFQSGEQAREWFDLMDEQGEQKALELLADGYDMMDVGGEHESSPVPSYGSHDDVYTGDYEGHRYILSYNRALGCIGLDRIEDDFIRNE
jgi:hypothetical protein